MAQKLQLHFCTVHVILKRDDAGAGRFQHIRQFGLRGSNAHVGSRPGDYVVHIAG